MKTRMFLSVITFVVSLNLSAQDHKLSFDFGWGIDDYNMESLNTFFIDSFTKQPAREYLQDYIKKGNQFRLSLSYKPNQHFDIGLYGSYQFGKSESEPVFIETNDWGVPIKEHYGTYELKTEAVSAGLTATWYVDGLLKWNEKENALKRFHFGLELSSGVGFSNVLIDARYPTLPIQPLNEYYRSTDFHGQFGIKAEYDITTSPVFTTLGLRTGYQYFKTNTVKDRVGNEWIVDGQHPINLDFSGFYGGVYLKIGK